VKKSLVIRSVVYIGIGLMLLFTARFSGTFRGNSREGALPPVNIDKITADHLEEGRWDSALEDLIPLFEHTKDPNLRVYIAWCFKELCVAAFQDQQYEDAAVLSESGLTYATSDADLHLVLGAARLAQSDYEAAEAAFIKVLEVNSANAEAHKQLGEIYYLRNEPEKAEAAWSKAQAFDPGDAALKKRLTALRKHLRLKDTLDTDDNLHFSVTYDGETMPRLEYTVLETLENAYYEIGAKLQIYPKRQISVTLLTRQAFFDVTGSPDWTAGLYEGQIEIPVAGADPDRLRRTLYHEYTHTVLFDQMGFRCPWWLNEGLAQYLSDDGNGKPETGHSAREKSLQSNGVTLSALGGVLGQDEKMVAQSYTMALSGVRYFVASFGEAMIQKIILLMAEGNSFETAFQSTTGYSFDRFEDDWRRDGI
jgi:tetratricopeptide (TPR) repeat protein